MISRLPPWIWTGAWLLACIAGFVNVIGLLGFERQAVTHLTGTTSMLSAAVATADWPSAMHYATVIGAFLIGTVFSGLVVQDQALQLGYRYSLALFLEAGLLAASGLLLNRHSVTGIYTAACACGLQNAMVSTYSGAVVRTTHLSGMLTDLGIFLGHTLRKIPVDPRRLRLCIVVISGFACGGVVGALAFLRLSYSALFIPAGFTALAALGYGVYQLRREAAR